MSKTKRRFYWIKSYSHDVNDEVFDYIMSFENGPTINTIYSMLLHLVINRDGIFRTKIHNVEIIDSPEKIKRDLKYFKFGDVTFTLGLLINLGLMAQMDDGAYYFIDYDERVGSESASAQRMRKARKKEISNANKTEEKGKIKQVLQTLSHSDKKVSQTVSQCSHNVTQEIREESIEKKSKEIKSLETRGGDDLIESPPSPSSAGELLALFKKINPNLSSPDKLSAEHRLAVDTLLDKGYSYQKIETVFQVVKENAFLNGSIDKPNWNGATFEFVINVRNFEKILAGQYVQPGESSQQNYAPPQVTSHDPMDDDIQERLREKYAQN